MRLLIELFKKTIVVVSSGMCPCSRYLKKSIVIAVLSTVLQCTNSISDDYFADSESVLTAFTPCLDHREKLSDWLILVLFEL